VTCQNGVELEISSDTWIHFRDGTAAEAQRSIGGVMFTMNDGVGEFSLITDVTPLWFQWVRQLYLGKREFAHGTRPNKLGFTHNMSLVSTK